MSTLSKTIRNGVGDPAFVIDSREAVSILGEGDGPFAIPVWAEQIVLCDGCVLFRQGRRWFSGTNAVSSNHAAWMDERPIVVQFELGEVPNEIAQAMFSKTESGGWRQMDDGREAYLSFGCHREDPSKLSWRCTEVR